MKQYLFNLCLLGIVMMTCLSCGDNNDPPLFVMQLETDFIIPSGLNTFDTHIFVIRDVPTRFSNYVGANFETSSIAEILSNDAQLSARFNDIDWAIVREISVRARSASDPSIDKEIFFQDNIKFDNVNELRLFGSNPEVRDILVQDRVTIEVRMNFRRPTPIEIEGRLTMNFSANGPK